MTDGRIPGKWISEPRFAEMPDAIFGFLARAIAWSNEAGTDGHVKNRYLGQLHATGQPQPHTYEYLVQAGLWEPVEDGYQFLNWSLQAHRGGLGQSTAEAVQAGMKRNREKQQRHRDRMKNDQSRNPVTLHGDVGQDRNTSSGSGSGSRDTQGETLKTASYQASYGVESVIDRQGTGDGDGDGDGDTPSAVETPILVRVPDFDPGYCSHGVTSGHRCRQCPSGRAEVA